MIFNRKEWFRPTAKGILSSPTDENDSRELGGHTQEEEIEELRKELLKIWNDKVQSTFEKEISKLQRMNPQVAEFSVQRNYIDLLLDLPWNHFSNDNFDLKRSEKFK